MRRRWRLVWIVLLGTMLPGVAPAGEANPEAAAVPDWKVADFESPTIYHSPQTPGYTCWVYLWKMPDQSAMAGFYQATGPAEGRPRAPMDVQKKLSWPHLSDPRRDMTGLKTCNVYLRSTDAGDVANGERGHVSQPDERNRGRDRRPAKRHDSPRRVRSLPYRRSGFAANGTRSAIGRHGEDVGQAGEPLAARRVHGAARRNPAAPRRARRGRRRRGRVPCGGAWGEYGLVMEPLLLVSNDNGQTWGPPVPVIPEENRKGWACEECDVAELPDGDLFWVFRRCAGGSGPAAARATATCSGRA